MKTRLELHTELVKILGSRHVYFQPPENLRMEYPAIVYERSQGSNVYGDDIKYLRWHQYQITIIDPNPDSGIVERMADFPYTRYVRHFTTEGLNHDVFQVVW